MFIRSLFANESVLWTIRPMPYHNVLFYRSMWLVSPLSFPQTPRSPAFEACVTCEYGE